MDEADDNGNDETSDGWLATIGEIGSGVAAGIGELVVGKEDLALIGRWRPVLGAGRQVLASFGRLGWYLAREATDDEEGPPGELLEELSERTSELIGAFPNIADLYADVDVFDRRLREGLDKSGADATLFAYLEWLHGFVEVVIERAVEVAFGADERQLSPERTAEFLERVDAMIRAVLERWILPSIVEPGPGESDERAD